LVLVRKRLPIRKIGSTNRVFARALVRVGLVAVILEHVPDFVAAFFPSVNFFVKFGYQGVLIVFDRSQLFGHQLGTLAYQL
jgi:hypothetical protein